MVSRTPFEQALGNRSSVNLEQVTPMILAYNEEDNLPRTLQALRWARRVIVVDSFSTDRTLEICRGFDNVEVAQRKFDSAASQGNFGLSQVETTWTLSLDSDYFVPDGFVDELQRLDPADDITGYFVGFRYAVFGAPLRGTLYPPRQVLYRTAEAKYLDDGHTQRVRTTSETRNLECLLIHDDRKSLSRWFHSQIRYARLEAEKLASTPAGKLGRADRLRKLILPAPFAALFYTLFVKGVILDGWPGWYYSLQRFTAELILSLTLLDRKLR